MAGPALERRAAADQVALLFTDLAGSTSLFDELGDLEADAVLKEHFRLLRSAVAECDGTEVKSLGDGLMVAFETTGAAVRCAQEMQRAVAAHNTGPAGRQLGLRVGVNVGGAIREGGDYFGMTVVIAKRLCDRAREGQIFVSDAVRAAAEQIGGEIVCRDLGPLSLKGLADPHPAHEVLWHAHGAPALRAVPGDGRSDAAPMAPVRVEGVPLQRIFSAPDTSAFVGRATDLERLAALWQRTRGGAGQVVFVDGEPGIGKTRLAVEVARRAHEEGALVLYGHCGADNVVPFQPLVESLGHWVEHAPRGELRRHLGTGLGPDVGRLLPEAGRRLPDLPEPRSADPETARFRMFEGVRRLLSGLATDRPLLLILDDLQWADRPTLLMLGHVLASDVGAPLMVVALYRADEVPARAPLADLLAKLEREGKFERLALASLGPDDVHALIAAWAGSDPSRPFGAALWEATEGNPFFVREVLRHLLESGAIEAGEDGLTSRTDITGRGIPESVRGLILRRLAGLGDQVNRVLAVASVIGRGFAVSVLQRACDLPPASIWAALEDAAAAGLVDEVPHIAGRFRFSHAMVREALYQAMTPTGRARVHGLVGEAIEALHPDDLQPRFAELAHHFTRAAGTGSVDKAVGYAEAAAREATSQLAYEEAAGHYERALDALALRESPDDLHRCDLLLALGESHRSAGDPAQARATFQSAIEVAGGLGSPEQLARAALGLGGTAFGAAWYGEGVVDEDFVALLETARNALGDADSRLRARICTRLARELYWSAAYGRREQLSQEAVDIARRLDDPVELAAALVGMYFATFGPDQVDERTGLIEEAMELAERGGDLDELLEVEAFRIIDQLERADRDAFDASVGRYAEHAQQLGHAHHLWYGHVLQALQAALDGRLDEGERLAGEALALGQSAEDQNALLLYSGQIAAMRWEQGRYHEVEAALRGFAVQYPALPIFRCGVAILLSESGRAPEARAIFDRLAANGFADIPRDLYWLSNMGVLSAVAFTLGDERRAALLYELLTPYADRYIVHAPALGSIGPVALQLALLALMGGRLDQAVAHCRHAVQLAARMRDRPWIAIGQDAYAALLAIRGEPGDQERAEEIGREAQEIARETVVMLPRARQALLARMLTLAAAHGRREHVGRALGLHPGMPAAEGRPRTARLARVQAVARERGISALAGVVRGWGDEQIERRFGSVSVQRALFAAIAVSFQPSKAYGFQGKLVYELTRSDGSADCWTIEVGARRARVRRGAAPDAAVRTRVSLPDFVRVTAGELNPVGLMLEGGAEVAGDLSVASRLVEMFGGLYPG